MDRTSSQEPSDQLRIRLTELKRETYPLAVLFYVIRQTVEGLGIAEDLDSEQVDHIVFNAMIEKLKEGRDHE